MFLMPFLQCMPVNFLAVNKQSDSIRLLLDAILHTTQSMLLFAQCSSQAGASLPAITVLETNIN